MKFGDIRKMHDAMQKIRIKCKCGHSIVVPPKINRVICSWCGNYVYKDPKEQFKHDLIKMMRKENKQEGIKWQRNTNVVYAIND